MLQLVQSARYLILVSSQERAVFLSVCSVSRHSSMIQRVVLVVVQARRNLSIVQLDTRASRSKSLGWIYLVVSSLLM